MKPFELRSVSKVFGPRMRALDGVSFAIDEGEHTCLLGPNGAGKTTLIRLLTGALQPTSGTVSLFENAPDDLASRRRIGIVPQGPGMYRDVSVREYLRLVRDLYGRGDVDETLTIFSLTDDADRPLAQLSGGLQRRASLAAAMMPKPELLLLDEPTVGLDPIATREVHAHLRQMMQGRTVLLCTHNLAEAEALCQSVAVLRSGKLLVHQRISELRGRLAPQLALRAVEGPDAIARALTPSGLAAQTVGTEVRVTLANPEKETPPLLRTLLSSGASIFEARIIEATLEDLFLAVLQGGEPSAPTSSLATAWKPPARGRTSWREVRTLLGKEWRQLVASKMAMLTALALPTVLMLIVPMVQLLAARYAGPRTRLDPVQLKQLPPILAEASRDPLVMVRLIFPLLTALAGLLVPSVTATFTLLSERESRTLELLIALPVRVGQILAAKLLSILALAAGATVTLFAIDAAVLSVLHVGGLAYLISVLAVLLSGLAYSTASALLVSLVAKDYRTANNINGALLVPTLMLCVPITFLVAPTWLAALAMSGALAAGAFVSVFVSLRVITFERLLR